MTKPLISIIVPTLNEQSVLLETLKALQVYRARGHEVIVVDAGSHDKTVSIALKLADKLLQTMPGRGLQMNEGAQSAKHDVLLFLHADTFLPDNADKLIEKALYAPENCWGRFNLKLTGGGLIYRFIETTINWRTYISGIATGDQAIFIKREMFERVAAFDVIPLMEDVALGKKLLKYARPCCLSNSVISSSRRWEEQGIVKTVTLMWLLRVAYFFGVKPSRLAQLYYPNSK